MFWRHQERKPLKWCPSGLARVLGLVLQCVLGNCQCHTYTQSYAASYLIVNCMEPGYPAQDATLALKSAGI